MKMRNTIWLVAVVMALLVSASVASATVVALPNTAQGSTLTANVSDQADVAASSAIAFAVSDVTGSTANTTDATITVSAMVLVNGNALKVEIQADAETFNPPALGHLLSQFSLDYFRPLCRKPRASRGRLRAFLTSAAPVSCVSA